jgi:uncharacterized protein YprB with RNaseH-like and TPR domain
VADLRDRLKRIHDQRKSELPQQARMPPSSDISGLTCQGWELCGFQTLKREVIQGSPFETMESLPQALEILIPDLAGRKLPCIEDFLFFDLETTGLSGGAGTAAFLAAFGKPLSGKKLHITQYLLLDYPGESDFLEAVLGEFKNEKSVIVSYNGKCFDSQILKSRCLMNRIKPPEYIHVDLLHPARRLWKNVIHDCSQGSVETQILGIDRIDDIPGALAPEIWFDFLKTGNAERLIGICDHNRADIAGLASILAAVISIAEDPFCLKYRCDIEKLVLYWRCFIRRQEKYLKNEKPEITRYEKLRITGNELLRRAAESNFPHAAFVCAQDQIWKGNYEEGRKSLLKIIKSPFPENIKAAAFRALAIDSERRLKDIDEAKGFVRLAMELEQAGAVWQKEFEKRKERLEKRSVFIV